MLPKERARIALVFMIANIFAPLLGGVSQAGECRMAPIKPIHCVRGIVIGLSGGRISNVRLRRFYQAHANRFVFSSNCLRVILSDPL
jgi:hypothetical protein